MAVQLYGKGDHERPATEPPQANRRRTPNFRSPFRRDFARLIHSPSFRRLQGKTQLFPSPESDFFRNRLTHSLEVAQIAKTVAQKANSTEFSKHAIDVDIVEFAGLAHDLGHPPFGHNGEEALDRCMRGAGGFEGNAQTLRILCRLEKKRVYTVDGERQDSSVQHEKNGSRAGLNLTFRCLAAILKYDRRIKVSEKKFQKGYYASEVEIVQAIKTHVVPNWREGEESFKTLECKIMDLSDDIAYSTYDLEDSFKAGFMTPIEMIGLLENQVFRQRVASKVEDTLRSSIPDDDLTFTEKDLFNEIAGLFSQITGASKNLDIKAIAKMAAASRNLAANGFLRTEFTSELVAEFIDGVRFEWNHKMPALSDARLDVNVLRKVEVLKRFVFEAMTMSPRLQIANYRGQEIVTTIFESMAAEDGHLLMPEDVRDSFLSERKKAVKKRIICDYVSGMTDRYAVEFYQRLKSAEGLTIFKPH